MTTLKNKLFRLFTSSQGGGGGLPISLQQVDYIEAYGLAYIDTGVTSSANTKIEIECCASDITPSTQHSRVLLTAGDNTSQMIAVYPNVGENEMNIRFGSVWVPSSATVDAYQKMKVTFDNSSLTVEQNGTSATDTFTAGTIGPGTIYLFKISYSSAYWATGKVYSLKIWDGGTLVRDMVPCYRKTTRELGFYDYVSQSFFENSGVGSFHAKYLDFPTGYTQCKYIDSSAQQYFSTGLRINNTHRIDMNMMPLPNADGTVQAYFGAWDGTNNTYIGKGNAGTWRIYYAHGASTNQRYLDMGTEANYSTLKAICADRTEAFYVNADSATSTKNTYTNGTDSYMFARHNKNSSLDEAAILSSIRMYNCNVYYNGSRYRTYVPCYRNSDSVPGMYDLNTGNFYSSATNIEFTKGADI